MAWTRVEVIHERDGMGRVQSWLRALRLDGRGLGRLPVGSAWWPAALGNWPAVRQARDPLTLGKRAALTLSGTRAPHELAGKASEPPGAGCDGGYSASSSSGVFAHARSDPLRDL